MNWVWSSEDVTPALEAIRTNRGDQEARLWLGRLLDPARSHDAMRALFPLIDSSGDFDADYVAAKELALKQTKSEQGADSNRDRAPSE